MPGLIMMLRHFGVARAKLASSTNSTLVSWYWSVGVIYALEFFGARGSNQIVMAIASQAAATISIAAARGDETGHSHRATMQIIWSTSRYRTNRLSNFTPLPKGNGNARCVSCKSS